MTRKDYQLIAKVFWGYAAADSLAKHANDNANQPPSEADKARQSRLQALALTLSDSLKQDNPNFNRETFLKACGI